MKTFVTLDYREKIVSLIFSAAKSDAPPTLDTEVLDTLERHLQKIHAESELFTALVVQSRSPKYFLVGEEPQTLKQFDKDSIVEWVQKGHEVFNLLEDLPLPVIAKVTGRALGGGFELAMACDFIVCSENASFGHPEAGFGFVPGWGGTSRLAHRIGVARAKELIFTGKLITAAEAYRIGLASFVGTDAQLDAYLTSTIQQMEKNSALAISLAKRLVKSSVVSNLQVNWDKESLALSVCLTAEDTQNRLNALS